MDAASLCFTETAPQLSVGQFDLLCSDTVLKKETPSESADTRERIRLFFYWFVWFFFLLPGFWLFSLLFFRFLVSVIEPYIFFCSYLLWF